MKKVLIVAALVSLGTAGSPVFAAVDWSLSMISGSNTSPAPVYGNERVYSDSGAGVSAAFSAISSTGSGSGNAATIESAYLSIYTPSNGLGVVNRDGSNSSNVALGYSGGVYKDVKGNAISAGGDTNEYVDNGSEHSMDNQGRYDSILVSFSTDQVALNSLKLGWTNNDSDVFVLAWTGGGAPALIGSTYAAMSASNSGWTIVSNLSNVGTNNTVSFNTTGTIVSSSYWLIGTGGFASGTGVTNDSKADYVKLAAIGGQKMSPPPSGGNSVPEPGSLALAGLGALGLIGMRRRKVEG